MDKGLQYSHFSNITNQDISVGLFDFDETKQS